MGFKETFDISDEVYSYLVYGFDVLVDENGELVESDEKENAVALMSIIPPFERGGVPVPHVTPFAPDEDRAISASIDEIHYGDIISVPNKAGDDMNVGMIVDIDEENETAVVMLDDEAVELDVGANYNNTVNGQNVSTSGVGFRNSDDEHEKDWWKIEEFEQALENE